MAHAIDRDFIHPLRYRRTRPFIRDIWKVGQSSTGGFPGQRLVLAATEVVASAYQAAVSKLPIEQRPRRPTSMISDEVALFAKAACLEELGRTIMWIVPDVVRYLEGQALPKVPLFDVHVPHGGMYLAFGAAFDGALSEEPNTVDGAYVFKAAESAPIEITITSRRTDIGSDEDAAKWPMSRDRTFYVQLGNGEPNQTLAAALFTALAEKRKELKERASGSAAEEIHGNTVYADVRPLSAADELDFFGRSVSVATRAIELTLKVLVLIGAEPNIGRVEFPEGANPDLVKFASEAADIKARRRAIGRLLQDSFAPVRVVEMADIARASDAMARQKTSSSSPRDAKFYLSILSRFLPILIEATGPVEARNQLLCAVAERQHFMALRGFAVARPEKDPEYLDPKFFSMAAESYRADLRREIKTTFSSETQEQIGYELWRHMHTPPFRGAFDSLWNAAFVRLFLKSRNAAGPENWVREARRFSNYLERLLMADDETGVAMLHDAERELIHPPFAVNGSMPMVQKVLAEVHDEQVGFLLRMPYAEMRG